MPKEADGKGKPGTALQNTRTLSDAQRLSVIERTKMKNNFIMALETKKQEEMKTGKTQKEMEKQALEDAEANKVATKAVQQNMLSQKE